MADVSFLTSLGLDAQLLTAGCAGGLVKAIFGKSTTREAVLGMLASALMSNYGAVPAIAILSSGALLGIKLNVGQNIAGFGVGLFAVLIVALLESRLGTKSKEEKNP